MHNIYSKIQVYAMMLLLFPTMSKSKMNQKRWNPEFQIILNHKINPE